MNSRIKLPSLSRNETKVQKKSIIPDRILKYLDNTEPEPVVALAEFNLAR